MAVMGGELASIRQRDSVADLLGGSPVMSSARSSGVRVAIRADVRLLVVQDAVAEGGAAFAWVTARCVVGGVTHGRLGGDLTGGGGKGCGRGHGHGSGRRHSYDMQRN